MSVLLNIKPNVVSRNLKGYCVSVYSAPKKGKTTFASKFPKPLIVAGEKGYSAIEDVMAYDVDSWTDLITLVKELKKPEVKAAYETICLDTLDIIWQLATSYVCRTNPQEYGGPVEDISQARGKFGKGEVYAQQLLANLVDTIMRLGYGVVMISHSTEKSVVINGVEANKIVPTLPKRALSVFTSKADIFGYIDTIFSDELDEYGFQQQRRIIYTRDVGICEAGSRFNNFPPYVEFSYEGVVKAIEDATTGIKTTDEVVNRFDNGLDLDELKAEFDVVKDALIAKDSSIVPQIIEIIHSCAGDGATVSSMVEGDEKTLKAIIEQLKAL